MSEPRPIHTIPPPSKWRHLLCNAHVALVLRVALENSTARGCNLYSCIIQLYIQLYYTYSCRYRTHVATHAVAILYLLVLNKVLVCIASLYMRLILDQPDRGMYSYEHYSIPKVQSV